MISKVGQIMLYVHNQDESVAFWKEKVGFKVIDEGDNGVLRWIEVAPSEDSETSIVLHNKDIVAKMSPEVNLGTPSLMFFTDNLDQLHKDLAGKGVTVGKITDMGSGRVFNFCDDEQNYFAVMEQKR